MGTREIRRKPPAAVRREVLADPCAYCDDDATHVDHIVPLAQGGTDDRENLAPACRWCNEEKLDFTPEQWRAWREERGMPWPPVPRFARMWEAIAATAAQFTEEDFRAAGY
jgi:hypothetical protein